MFGKKCDICERKTTDNLSHSYKNDQGEIITVCLKCVNYVEERNYEQIE